MKNNVQNFNVFSNKCVYKVATLYTPYQLVYVLYSLMLTKYVILSLNGRPWNVNPIQVLISQLHELEKLQEYRLDEHENMIKAQWNRYL